MLNSICKDSHYILYIQVLIFFLFKFGMSLTCSINLLAELISAYLTLMTDLG